MGIKDKVMKKVVDKQTTKVAERFVEILESIHAHLELQLKELVTLRMLLISSTTNDNLIPENLLDNVDKEYKRIVNENKK